MTTQTSAPAVTPDWSQVMTAAAALPNRLMAAWAAHDAEAFSQLFAPDGTLIMAGVYVKGRDQIRQYMEDGYASHYKGTTVKGKPIDIKPLGSDAVALLTEGGVIFPGEQEYSSKEAIRASWILIKSEGEWRLAVYHNCPRDPAS